MISQNWNKNEKFSEFLGIFFLIFFFFEKIFFFLEKKKLLKNKLYPKSDQTLQ